MTLRYAFLLEYDGGYFSGWQSQLESPLSVQCALERALSQLTQEKSRAYAAGRTDAGVHALGQVAHVDFIREYPCEMLRKGTNYYLKNSGIQVLRVEKVDSEFHARFSAEHRVYVYAILARPSNSPLWANRAWWVSRSLDLCKLQEAAEILVGTWDFSNFRNAACQAKNPIRTMDRVHSVRAGDMVWITFQAKSFLHRQVRMMTGAMIQFATHSIQRSEFLRYFDASQSVKPLAAPAHGLYLKKIMYRISIF